MTNWIDKITVVLAVLVGAVFAWFNHLARKSGEKKQKLRDVVVSSQTEKIIEEKSNDLAEQAEKRRSVTVDADADSVVRGDQLPVWVRRDRND